MAETYDEKQKRISGYFGGVTSEPSTNPHPEAQPKENPIDTANRMTKEFLQSHGILPGDHPNKTGAPTAADARKKYGPGYEQAIID